MPLNFIRIIILHDNGEKYIERDLYQHLSKYLILHYVITIRVLSVLSNHRKFR